MKIKITLLSLWCAVAGFAQVTNERNPQSWKDKSIEAVEAIIMPDFDLEALKKEDAVNDIGKDKPWRFGHEFVVDYNLENSGTWTTLANGDRIWRIRFASAGAKTINFLFSDFFMPKGAGVYLYNSAHTDVLGAYNEQQNNTERTLGTWMVQGEDVYIEYFEPAAVAGQGKLEVFKVIHGYRTQDDGFLKAVDDDLNASGACNYDVDCYIGDLDQYKEINKKSVAIIITGGSGFCTGALVNNTSNDGTPYFLTADHCYSNPAQWAFRFNWISPNPVCAATTPSTNNTNYYQTASGATLRARNTPSDFCLVEITANMPTSWDLVYAGWDRSSTAPSSAFGIHHPSGDIMKTCVDYGPLTSDSGYWYIEDWDLGVTEGGSSGSPLFDSNGRVRGQLNGGFASCSGTTDNGGYDRYGRLDVSWTGSNAASRLSDWLDPEGTGQTTLDYYPPQEVYALDARVTIVETALEGCTGALAPVVRLVNNGSQTLTSATINAQLNNGAVATVNWTGNLATGQAEEIALAEMTAPTGENTLTVTAVQPNGGTDGNPGDNTASADFSVNIYIISEVEINITTDDYGDETSWEITNENGTVVQSGGGYGDNQTSSDAFDLPLGCYTFTIFDEYEDGMCCEYGNGGYEVLIGGQVIATGGNFGAEESVVFTLEDEMGTAGNALQNAVTVFPNPSKGEFTIQVNNGLQPEYTVYSVLGQQLATGKVTNNGTINLGAAANGVYLLEMQDKATGAKATFKLVKE